MVMREHSLPVTRRCELLEVARSTAYYRPRPVSDADLALMRLIDEVHLELPFYGSRRMRDELETRGHRVNRKRVQRLMREMGLAALYAKPRTSVPGHGHKVYPYLLKDVSVERPNQVWATDIGYIPMARGFMYRVAVMDWYSRRVLSWQISNTLDGDLCVEALEAALARYEAPQIFNTDQGAQFTAAAFTDQGAWGGDQYGWQGALARQRLRRRPVAQREVRGCLPARLRDAGRAACRAHPLLRLLQCAAPARGAGPTHPGCGVLRDGHASGLKHGGDFT